MYFQNGMEVSDISVCQNLLKSITALHGSETSRIGAGWRGETSKRTRGKGDLASSGRFKKKNSNSYPISARTEQLISESFRGFPCTSMDDLPVVEWLQKGKESQAQGFNRFNFHFTVKLFKSYGLCQIIKEINKNAETEV